MRGPDRSRYLRTRDRFFVSNLSPNRGNKNICDCNGNGSLRLYKGGCFRPTEAGYKYRYYEWISVFLLFQEAGPVIIVEIAHFLDLRMTFRKCVWRENDVQN